METNGELRSYYTSEGIHLERRRETEKKYIGVFTATADNTNDPELTASVNKGKILLEVIASRIAERVKGTLVE